ncbi:MAG: hypothetical protein H6617_12115 [Bdellovibrionaceae bacterium]|nr:hypothetical protein [Bdellovibrionales bacterium]MCB9255419.1 hypothetical protein [Pseudobdellovibrionaceae bacterium]
MRMPLKIGALLVALGAIWTLPIHAVSVQIFVEPPAPANCSSAVKAVLNRKLLFLDPNQHAEIYVKPIRRFALAGSGGIILSPTDFFARFAASLPPDGVLAQTLELLRTANRRPDFISCVLGRNCSFIAPPNAEQTGARYTAHHATIGGSLRLESFEPGAVPSHAELSALSWRQPDYVAIVVDPPKHESQHLLVDWYADWVHEGAHVFVLDKVGQWLRALRTLATREVEIHDEALRYLRVNENGQVLEAAFFYLLTEGIAHRTDSLVHTAFQPSPQHVPDVMAIQEHLLTEIRALRSTAENDLRINQASDVFDRAGAFFHSMQQTIDQAAALP